MVLLALFSPAQLPLQVSRRCLPNPICLRGKEAGLPAEYQIVAGLEFICI